MVIFFFDGHRRCCVCARGQGRSKIISSPLQRVQDESVHIWLVFAPQPRQTIAPSRVVLAETINLTRKVGDCLFQGGIVWALQVLPDVFPLHQQQQKQTLQQGCRWYNGCQLIFYLHGAKRNTFSLDKIGGPGVLVRQEAVQGLRLMQGQ